MSKFVINHQQLTADIEQHERIIDELNDESNRLSHELAMLIGEREQLIADFAANMLRIASK